MKSGRLANRIVRALDKVEAGIADSLRFSPWIGNKLLLEFLQAPLVRHSFNTVRRKWLYRVGQLVVYQHTLT